MTARKLAPAADFQFRKAVQSVVVLRFLRARQLKFIDFRGFRPMFRGNTVRIYKECLTSRLSANCPPRAL